MNHISGNIFLFFYRDDDKNIPNLPSVIRHDKKMIKKMIQIITNPPMDVRVRYELSFYSDNYKTSIEIGDQVFPLSVITYHKKNFLFLNSVYYERKRRNKSSK